MATTELLRKLEEHIVYSAMKFETENGASLIRAAVLYEEAASISSRLAFYTNNSGYVKNAKSYLASAKKCWVNSFVGHR